MATKNKKIKLGNNLVERQPKNFNKPMIEGAICLDVLQTEQVKALSYEYEGKTYLNVKIMPHTAPKFKATHYIEVDQFVPNKKKGE